MRKEYLKIKDDVNLKELEKFDFHKYHSDFGFDYYCYNEFLVYPENRRISLFKIREEELIKFFDLCQAGLVEKVVEDE